MTTVPNALPAGIRAASPSQRARRKSPIRPGSTLFTATPLTVISTNRGTPTPGVAAMRRQRTACRT